MLQRRKNVMSNRKRNGSKLRLQHCRIFDKIQLSKIIEKVFIYEPGRIGDKLEDG